MGYFDGLVDGSFKTTDEGITIFYPYGIFGVGFIIPSNEKKQEIRKHLKRFTFFSLTIILVSAYLLFLPLKIHSFPWWIAGLIYLAIVAGLTLVGLMLSKRLIDGLTQVDNKITLAESYQNAAKSHNLFILVLLELASLLFVGTGVLILQNDSAPWYFRLNGVLSIIFFGFGSIAIGYMIKVKIKG